MTSASAFSAALVQAKRDAAAAASEQAATHLLLAELSLDIRARVDRAKEVRRC